MVTKSGKWVNRTNKVQISGEIFEYIHINYYIKNKCSKYFSYAVFDVNLAKNPIH